MLFRHTATFFLLLLLLYTCVSGGHIYSGDGVIMHRVTEALWERGEVSVRPIEGYEGYAVRTAADGKAYGKYGPGLSVVSVPFYAAGRAAARLVPAAATAAFDYPALLYYDRHDKDQLVTAFFSSLTNAAVVAALGALVLSLLLLSGFSVRFAFFASLLFALGSPAPFFAKTFFSEPLTALGLLLSWWCIELYRKDRGVVWLVFSGACAGLAVTTRLSAALAVVALAVGLLLVLSERGELRSARSLLLRACAWVSPVALALGLMGAYNFARFGSVLETGYGSEAGAFSAPFFEGLWGLLASPGRGLVWYAPLFLLCPAGLVPLWRANRPLAVASSLAFLALWLVHAPWHMWEGGWCYSPRFLFPALALLVPAGAYGARALWRYRAGRFALGALVTWSLAMSFQSVIVNYLDYHFYFFFNHSATKETFRWSWQTAPMTAYWSFPFKHFLIWPRLMLGQGGLALQLFSWTAIALAPVFAVRWVNVLRTSKHKSLPASYVGGL